MWVEQTGAHMPSKSCSNIGFCRLLHIERRPHMQPRQREQHFSQKAAHGSVTDVLSMNLTCSAPHPCQHCKGARKFSLGQSHLQ